MGARRGSRDAEDQLLLSVAQGDAAALRELYRAFERPLYTLGMRWLHDAEMAEELVQEVTVRIWRRATTFDPDKGAAGSWIFGMARNVASDLSRARARRPAPVSDIAVETEPWDEDAAWQGWQVARALRRLPIEQQRIIELAYVHGYSQCEIAETLAIPLGTVKTRLYKAHRTLRVALEAVGIVEAVAR
ncbi:MAG: sigma-70 family RNA polymerase sigma factor [Actinomycetota bacterium]|nr:sigma-70 family RNA polymerase sigma factor [Actinomycetota bacterium]